MSCGHNEHSKRIRHIWGINTIKPTTTAPIAEISTAPAETSFACFTTGWKSGFVTSQSNSKAVFNVSDTHTMIMTGSNKAQSYFVKPKSKPMQTIEIVATKWTQALCCVLSIRITPEIACLKLRKRPVNEKVELSSIKFLCLKRAITCRLRARF